MVRWGGFFTRYILGILLFGLAMYIFFPHIQILINRPYSPNFWNNLMADLAISWLAYLGVFVVVILYGLLWYIDEKNAIGNTKQCRMYFLYCTKLQINSECKKTDYQIMRNMSININE